MPNRVFVDTLFVVALINQRDEHHRRSLELSEEYEGHPLLVTDAVLLEIGNGLARKFKREAVEIIEEFFGADEVELVRLDAELFGEAFGLYKTHQDKAWGLIDCISFVVMRQHEVTGALTFDEDFTQAGFRALMREGSHE